MNRVTKQLEGVKTTRPVVLSGIKDIVADTNPLWSTILKYFQRTARTYGFVRVETGILDDLQFYKAYYKSDPSQLAGLLTSEIGNKTMVVRPALLPSVIRTYIQSKVAEAQSLSKWGFVGNVVRMNGKHIVSDYEFGLEVLGAFSHLTEAQVIGAIWQLVLSLGLQDRITLEINSIGNSDCQSSYQNVLKDYLKDKKFQLCDNCNEHLQGRALNILRCQNIDCQSIVSEAPTVLDFLDTASHKDFTSILEGLDELQIPYQLNPYYAGPEGHSGTNMVIKYKGGNNSWVIGEAGYHDRLFQAVSGKTVCSFGFSGSLNALHKALEASEVAVVGERVSEVFLVPLGELAAKRSLRLFRDLTEASVTVYDHFGTAGVKNQLKQAEAFKSPIALIMGQKEAMDEMVILRDVKSGMQEVFSYDKIVEEVKKRLGK